MEKIKEFIKEFVAWFVKMVATKEWLIAFPLVAFAVLAVVTHSIIAILSFVVWLITLALNTNEE